MAPRLTGTFRWVLDWNSILYWPYTIPDNQPLVSELKAQFIKFNNNGWINFNNSAWCVTVRVTNFHGNGLFTVAYRLHVVHSGWYLSEVWAWPLQEMADPSWISLSNQGHRELSRECGFRKFAAGIPGILLLTNFTSKNLNYALNAKQITFLHEVTLFRRTIILESRWLGHSQFYSGVQCKLVHVLHSTTTGDGRFHC